MPTKITNPIILDNTLQELVVATQDVATKLKTPKSDWDEKDTESLAYINNKPDVYSAKTETGNNITIDSGSTQSLCDVVIEITLDQAGSGTPSGSNIRPITGHSSVMIAVKDSDNMTVYSDTIALGQTVYGGSLNVDDNTLMITYGFIASYAGETLPGEWVSDRDVYSVGSTPTTGAQVAYALSEPIEIELPVIKKIRLVNGVNVVSTNMESISFSYEDDSASITELIDEANALFSSIAPIEGSKASRAYAKGEYMIYNGSFCKVTSAISSGGTITIGSNVSKTTIAAELKALA